MPPQSVSTYADFPLLLLWLWSVQVPWAICIDYGYPYCSCRSCWRTILYRTVNKQQTSNLMQFGGGTLPFDYGDNIHLHCNAINHWHWIFVLVSSFILYFQIWGYVGTRLLVCCCEKSIDDKEKPLPLFSWFWRHFGLVVSVLAPIKQTLNISEQIALYDSDVSCLILSK